MNLRHDLQFAVEVARGAGKLALTHYGKVERLTKTHSQTTLEAVTDADRASQRFIVQAIRRRFPADGVIGEENDAGDAITFDAPDPQGRIWVIDPIDGTNNFIAGFDNFAVCIGLLERGLPVLGVVFDVRRDSVYSAATGEGAWRDATRISAAATPMGDSSIVMMTSNLLDNEGRLSAFIPRWLSQTNWKIRIIGSAALEAVQVAAGVAHGAVTCNGKLWDIVAPAAIVLEAGGRICGLDAQPIFPFNPSRYAGARVPFLAAAPLAYDELAQEIRR